MSPSPPRRPSSATEDGLLLREFSHRTFNEIAVASAAVELARRGSDALDRDAVLEEAGSRLRDLGTLLRVLARPVEPSVDLASEIAELSRAMRAARPEAAASLELDLVAFTMEGAAARRMSLVAAELMANAYRHALAGRGGGMSIRLRRSAGQAVLEVSDDGGGVRGGTAVHGGAAGAGLGLGRGIVAELVSAAGGEVTLRTGPDGTTASVRMPVAVAAEEAIAGAR